MADQIAAPIPYDQALAICEEILKDTRGKWYTVSGMWCWGCLKFSKSVDGRCFANAEGNRGCGQVNTRFDRAAAMPPSGP